MTTGPLQRLIAMTGLASLVPVVAMLLTNSITPEVAALRAVAVIAAVIVLDQLARSILTGLLGRIEEPPSTSRRAGPQDSPTRQPAGSAHEPVTEARDTAA